MDAGREEILKSKREERAKSVLIVFPIKDNYQNFNVVDEHGNMKYSGFVKGEEPSLEDDCSCPNFKPLNNERWISTHGYNYQCKHLLGAREEALKQQRQIEIISKGVEI